MIQQLNGQTQRLLGQQSLAAYTGLRLDVDRIRADNEALTDEQVTRKAGLIIHDGGKLSKEEKAALQDASKVKYALSQEQMDAVDAALEEIYSARTKDDEESARHRGLVESWSKEVAGRPSAEEMSTWTREEKVARMKSMVEMLQQAQAVYRYQVRQEVGSVFARKHKAGSSDREVEVENNAKAANNAKMDVGAAGAAGPKSKKVKVGNGGNSGKRAAKATKKAGRKGKRAEEDDEVDDPMEFGEDDAARTAMECRAAGHEASISALVAMGFGRRQAKDALEETNGSVEGAVEWLMVHCVS